MKKWFEKNKSKILFKFNLKKYPDIIIIRQLKKKKSLFYFF